jgi:hypothetical protein
MGVHPQKNLAHHPDQGFGRQGRVHNLFPLLNGFLEHVENPVEFLVQGKAFKGLFHGSHGLFDKGIRHAPCFFIGPDFPKQSIKDVRHDKGKVGHLLEVQCLIRVNHAFRRVAVLGGYGSDVQPFQTGKSVQHDPLELVVQAETAGTVRFGQEIDVLSRVEGGAQPLLLLLYEIENVSERDLAGVAFLARGELFSEVKAMIGFQNPGCDTEAPEGGGNQMGCCPVHLRDEQGLAPHGYSTQVLRKSFQRLKNLSLRSG